MNITKKDTSNLVNSIKIEIAPDDYQEKVNSGLKDYQKKANIHGFRPGKVPVGILKKTYGNQLVVEEVNKLLSESLQKYITDNEINMLGEPVPSENEEVKMDFKGDGNFEFSFDIGLKPEFDIELSDKKK